MKKMYIIQWKSMVNGRAGKGTKRFDREQAEQLVEELNLEYPQIHHEMVEAEGHNEPLAPHARVESEPESIEMLAVH